MQITEALSFRAPTSAACAQRAESREHNGPHHGRGRARSPPQPVGRALVAPVGQFARALRAAAADVLRQRAVLKAKHKRQVRRWVALGSAASQCQPRVGSPWAVSCAPATRAAPLACTAHPARLGIRCSADPETCAGDPETCLWLAHFRSPCSSPHSSFCPIPTRRFIGLVACAALVVMALGFSQSSRRTSREEALNEVLAEETRTVAGRQMHQALSEGPRDNLPLTPSSSPTPEPPLHALPTENVWEYDPDRNYEYDSITTATALPAVISKSTSTALPTVVSTPTGTAAAEAVRNEPTSTRVPTQRHSDAVSLDGARAHAEALAKMRRTRAEHAASAPAQDAAGCLDSSSICRKWASAGECKRNPVFMHKQCQWSCGVCGSGAPWVDGYLGGAHERDEYEYAHEDQEVSVPAEAEACVNLAAAGSCDKWALAGECDRNSIFMHRQCQRACGLCPGADRAVRVAAVPAQPKPQQAEPVGVAGQPFAKQLVESPHGSSKSVAPGGAQLAAAAQPAPAQPAPAASACVDDEPRCSAWADAGECRLNPAFMSVHCRKSCGECAS